MKIDELEKGLKEQVLQLLNDAEDKSEAIYQAADMIATAKHKKLIDELTEQNARAAVDGEYRKRLGLRNLSGEEKQVYEKFKDIKQAITAKQVDIIPEEIIDRTLDDIKKKSDILKLVRFAPANVKRWLVAEHSGAAQWGPLTEEITAELSASFSSLTIEVGKLHVALVIPKAIQDLALPFVDRYFTAILAEAMQDGLVRGFLDGDGKEAPIGIMRMIGTTNEDGTNKAKTVLTSPKGLAGVRKTLTKNGMRSIGTLYLICNPKDEAEFVDPALYGESLAGGYRNTSFMNIEKIVDANVPEGKAIFTIADMYVMGASSIDMRTYDQTKAMEDADVIIGKCYANGRAVDNDTAVVFDVTKLEEYVLPVTQVTAPTA